MYETFLHKRADDTRSLNERDLTEKLVSKLTELNLKRVNKTSNENIENSDKILNSTETTQKIKNNENNENKTLFVCFYGIPPLKGEF